MKKIKTNLKKNCYRMLLISGIIMPFMVTNSAFATSTLTVTSSGSQSINVSAAGDGTAISSDNITVSTNCRYGYNFNIQASVDDNTLYLDGDSDNQDAYFWSGGTLDEGNDVWGYYYDEIDPVPTTSNYFYSVPTSDGWPETVKYPLDSPAAADITDNFTIYYGVSVSPAMPKGTYKMIPDGSNNDGTIVYTATVAEECSRYTVQFSPTSIFEGNTLTGDGTMYDQTMYEGAAESITANSFTAPSGYYFAGWNTAQDGSGVSYYDQQQVVDIPSTNNVATLYAMWTDCPGGTICYDANVSNPNDIEGEMGDQTISSSATSAVLYAPNFKRSNYGFAAWNTNPSGTGTNYGPNQTLEFTAGAYDAGGIKLYAKWIASAGNMQNWSGCSNMNQGDVTALKDTRGNEVYAVAKLADDKCWMIENLRLADKDSNNNYISLNSSNTHNPSLPLTNDYANSTTSYHLSTPIDFTQTAWCTSDSAACDDQSMLATNNTTLFVNNTSSNYSEHNYVYSYGNYYNWYSATAGRGTYSDFIWGNVAGDICPAGWHLPTGARYGSIAAEIGTLDVAMGGTGTWQYNDAGKAQSAKWRSYPNNFVYSGEPKTPYTNRGNSGHYWTSSAGQSAQAYYLKIGYSEIGVGGLSRNLGRSIRCIAGV